MVFDKQVRLPSMDGKVALVPWADMLNHSSEVPCYFLYFYFENLQAKTHFFL